MELQVWRWAGTGCVALGAALVALALASRAPLPLHGLGVRGVRRTRALQAHALLALVDPLLRWIGAWIGPALSRRAQQRVDTWLRQAGEPLGLCGSEWLALALLAMCVTAATGHALGDALGAQRGWLVASACVGPAWVWLSLTSHRERRLVLVDRGLPAVIDLTALCMGAGLDLPAALAAVVNEGAAHGRALREELQLLMRQLELGSTRVQALSAFGERLPTPSVRDLVSAVVQAEQKGTPLAEVLEVQATVLRERRSVLAEEAAARAGVWMMLPLLLLMGCTLLLAMGGMVIRSMESGL